VTAARATDVRIVAARLLFLPVRTRVPLKFGTETLTSVTCARVAVRVRDGRGRTAEGWGETPLSVQWVWPSALPYEERHTALRAFCVRLVPAFAAWERSGHALEIGHAFIEEEVPALLAAHNRERPGREPMPHLAALVAASAFDLALHDAYGVLHGRPVYETYGPAHLDGADLSRFITPAPDAPVSFAGRYPADFLVAPSSTLPAWHLVGGLDPLGPEEVPADAPRDGYPLHLAEWIRRDGLTCLKLKLRGTDARWDAARIRAVGAIAEAHDVRHLSLDFNCTVTDPAYVNDILDRVKLEQPLLFDRILYVEQPFPYDLEAHRIDVRSVAARSPLFMDESAHDWRLVRLGRELGWTGVALKTCKTQSGALLALAWARAHGMALMVQDLTNPMLAMIPHALLAAHAGTIMGLETNACQFYPEASAAEAAVHPGLYRRRAGAIDLGTLAGPGFGYRLGEIARPLPAPAAEAG
jgi:L-alanine-DL-glutamate epimerase-like enolase superfamily enzyme